MEQRCSPARGGQYSLSADQPQLDEFARIVRSGRTNGVFAFATPNRNRAIILPIVVANQHVQHRKNRAFRVFSPRYCVHVNTNDFRDF
jgi:hypothetical protein